MTFERNVGGLDRLARGVGGAALLLVALLAMFAGRWSVATGAALGSSGLLFNALVGWCGLNALLGIDTCSRE